MSTNIDEDINGNGSLIDVVLYGQNVQMNEDEWNELQAEMEDGEYPTKKELIDIDPIFDSHHITEKGTWDAGYQITDPDAYVAHHKKDGDVIKLIGTSQPEDMPIYDRNIDYTFDDKEEYLGSTTGGTGGGPTLWYNLKAGTIPLLWKGTKKVRNIENVEDKEREVYHEHLVDKQNKKIEDEAAQQVYQQRLEHWREGQSRRIEDAAKSLMGFAASKGWDKPFQYELPGKGKQELK